VGGETPSLYASGHQTSKKKVDMPKFDIPSTKDNHVFGDTAAVYNNAAKDDLVCTMNTQFSVQDLLANDPGSAAFVGFGDGDDALPAGVSFDELTQMLTVDWGVVGSAGFDYTIRMANGTYSTAHVVGGAAVAGTSLFSDSFETYTDTTAGDEGWGIVASLAEHGWISAGAAAEIVESGYQGIVSDYGTNWLDTQATGGPIDITHTVSDPNAGYAQITVSVATEVFAQYATGGTLDVYWNGTLVDSIDPTLVTGDFTANNTFKDFTYVVASDADGLNDLRIVDTASPGNVGFAVDLVGVVDWVCA
jgi:hypothetical protein